MTHEEALAVIKNGIIFGQKKGIYSLGDAKILKEAIDIVCPDNPSVPESGS